MSSSQARQPIKYHGTLQAPYQAAPLALARDVELGDAARSVALWLWSHSDGYRISQRSVMAEMGKGQGSVRKAFNELQAARWIVRQPVVPAPGGRVLGFHYHLTRDAKFTDADAERLSKSIVLDSKTGASVSGAPRSDAPEMDAVGVSKSDAPPVSKSDAQSSESKEVKVSSYAREANDDGMAEASAILARGGPWDIREEHKVKRYYDYIGDRCWVNTRYSDGLQQDDPKAFEEIGGPTTPTEAPEWFTAPGLTANDWQSVLDKRLDVGNLRRVCARAANKNSPTKYVRSVIASEDARPVPERKTYEAIGG